MGRGSVGPEPMVVRTPDPLPRGAGRREILERLAAGGRLRSAGTARHMEPGEVLRRYAPTHAVDLFGWRFLIGRMRADDGLGYTVTFVTRAQPRARSERDVFPRIVYKDSSLVWRVASHFVHDEEEYWIGKGAVRERRVGGHLIEETAEETTNLPFELQRAMDEISRRAKAVRDTRGVARFLQEGPSGRIRPYADFTRPRERAGAVRAVNGGRRVARFTRPGDPTSLTFARGFEPDLGRGVIERWEVESRFFGGTLGKVRVPSVNRRIQYLFFASPTHTWLAPPQALTAELSTFGVRLADVVVDDDLTIPGFEYHDEGESQIPAGFAGAPHPDDPHRADAGPWLRAIPVIREFQRKHAQWSEGDQPAS